MDARRRMYDRYQPSRFRKRRSRKRDREDYYDDDRSDEEQPKKTDSTYRTGGMALGVLAAAAVGACIANIVFTYFKFCQNGTSTPCSSTYGENYKTVLTLTWIAAGIWGALPAFVTALTAVSLSKDAEDPTKRQTFRNLALATVFLSCPAIIAIGSAEAYYDVNGVPPVYTIGGTNDTEMMIKFALTLAVTICGGLLFLLTAYLLYRFYQTKPEEKKERDRDYDFEEDYYYEEDYPPFPEDYPPPQPAPQPQPQPQPLQSVALALPVQQTALTAAVTPVPVPVPQPYYYSNYGYTGYASPYAAQPMSPPRAYYPNYFGYGMRAQPYSPYAYANRYY